jgi:hypothetical protein
MAYPNWKNWNVFGIHYKTFQSNTIICALTSQFSIPISIPKLLEYMEPSGAATTEEGWGENEALTYVSKDYRLIG